MHKHFTFQFLFVTLFATTIGNFITTYLDDMQSHDSHMTLDHTILYLMPPVIHICIYSESHYLCRLLTILHSLFNKFNPIVIIAWLFLFFIFIYSLPSCPSFFLPSGVSVARPIIAFYSRFRDICIYIYIYMSVCKCIVQDRAHLTQVLSRRPLHIWHTGCCSAHHFEESSLR